MAAQSNPINAEVLGMPTYSNFCRDHDLPIPVPVFHIPASIVNLSRVFPFPPSSHPDQFSLVQRSLAIASFICRNIDRDMSRQTDTYASHLRAFATLGDFPEVVEFLAKCREQLQEMIETRNEATSIHNFLVESESVGTIVLLAEDEFDGLLDKMVDLHSAMAENLTQIANKAYQAVESIKARA